jgi:hypothetical protein
VEKNLTPNPATLARVAGRIQSLSQEQERGLERGFPDPVKSKRTVEAIETLRSLSEKLRIRRDLL